MKNKRLYMRIEGDLFKRVDRQAKKVHRTRSGYITAVLRWAVEAAEEAEKNYKKERGEKL